MNSAGESNRFWAIVNRNQIACDVNGASSPFVFPQADAAWALQNPSLSPVAMSLTTVTDTVTAGGTPALDFVLVRTSNAVAAATMVN